MVRSREKPLRNVALPVLVLAALACSPAGDLLNATETMGTIISILPATSVDDQGRAIGPGFTFTSADPQITILVQVGDVDPSPLTLTWYQVTDEGDRKLFEDTIQVSAYDSAFSIGRNTGTLAAGTYRVIASLGGQTEEVEWDVAQIGAAPTPTDTSGPPIGQPPVSGGSGKSSGPARAATSGTPDTSGLAEGGPCIGGGEILGCGSSLADIRADNVELVVYNVGGSDTLTLGATVRGEFRALSGTVSPDSIRIWPIDPCTLPGGSDMPGTKVQAQAVDGTTGIVYSTVITLGDDTLAPRIASLTFSRERGSRVNPGETITIRVRAEERRRNGPWQTGVRIIQVRANHQDAVGETHDEGAVAKPCAEKKWEMSGEATYTVPENPPAAIELCAWAEDFAGNLSKQQCGQFFTAETWQGTLDGTGEVNDPCCEPSRVVYHATLQFTVDDRGNIDGEGVAELVEAVGSGCPEARQSAIPFFVSGRATENQLALRFGRSSVQCGAFMFTAMTVNIEAGEIIVPVTGPGIAEGKGELSSDVHSARGSYAIRLTCRGCLEAGR